LLTAGMNIFGESGGWLGF